MIEKPLLAALFACFASLLACGGCGSSQSASPLTPPAAPTTKPDPLPWIYSQVFSSASPLHTSVTTLKTGGATVLPEASMLSLWSQGIAPQDLSSASWMFPVYVSSASDPVKTFTCTKWGACNADGIKLHVPDGVLPEAQSDGHIGIIDTVLGVEVDGWQCTVTVPAIACSWGAQYAFGGTGLENTGSNAVHGGFAAGLIEITAQELQNGQIDHALGLLTSCLDNPTVYPADQNTNGTDQPCGGTGAPSYGDLLHLVWTPAQIASSPYSAECKTVLTALATYGAYTFDTGNHGLALLTQHQFSYTAIGQASPWSTKILANLAVSGDASGTAWHSCLNRLGPSDFELLQIPVGKY